MLAQLQAYRRQAEDFIAQSVCRKSGSNFLQELFDFDETEITELETVAEKAEAIRNLIESKLIYRDGQLKCGTVNYQAGYFVAPTLAELRNQLSQLNIAPGKLTVQVEVGKDVSLAHLQAEPGDLFQGASQFNALEMIDPDKTNFDGINIYRYDKTQGPRTALSCCPGTIVRNYHLSQQLASQFNALELMKISHLNGYLIWGNEPINSLIKLQPEKLRIPAMLYTQVAGLFGNQAVSTEKLVHQVYCSAVPINTYRNSGNYQQQLEIARLLIRAAYCGTIAWGLILGQVDQKFPIINLTLLGAGVFNVPLNIVVSCLKEALAEFQNYPGKVIIHDYSNSLSKLY